MTRASDEQMELDFENDLESSELAVQASHARFSAPILCFSAHLRLRRRHEDEAKDAKVLERITSRVQHFK